MIWLLVFTCHCGEPLQPHYATRAACEQAAHWEMAARRINVPSYRCTPLRVWP